jgi:hypothetical protein
MGSRAFTHPYLSKLPSPRKGLNRPIFTFVRGARNARFRGIFLLSQAKLAGAEGLEPPTYGFGDRRSTN